MDRRRFLLLSKDVLAVAAGVSTGLPIGLLAETSVETPKIGYPIVEEGSHYVVEYEAYLYRVTVKTSPSETLEVAMLYSGDQEVPYVRECLYSVLEEEGGFKL